MYTTEKIIRLSQTDATGVLFFSELFDLALEAFEAFLSEKGIHLQSTLSSGEFFLPIVHAEGDYSGPLRAGDRVELHLTLEKMGTSSFTLKTVVGDAGEVRIVHVVQSKQTQTSMPIPEDLKTILSGTL